MKNSSTTNFLFAGNWAYSNRGCEAIVRGTTTLLRETTHQECRFISNYFSEELCTDKQNESDPAILHRPFPHLKRYSLPWIQDQVTRKLLRQPVNRGTSRLFRQSLQEAHAVLMLGGDTFSLDYSNTNLYFELSNLAVNTKLPVTIWGASIGPFTSDADYEQWAVGKLKNISLLCARETETLHYLQSLGLTKNVILTADPSYYMPPSPCNLPEPIQTVLAHGCVGINLSPLMHRYIHTHSENDTPETGLKDWVKIATAVISAVSKRFSRPVLLIPHVISEMGNIFRDDYLFLQHIADQIQQQKPETGRILVLPPQLNASQLKWVISQLHLFAGARTHSTLASLSSGVPTICIGYSMKAKGIAKDVYGHLDWLVPGQTLVKEPELLSDMLLSLDAQADSIRQHLTMTNPVFKQRAREAAVKFHEIIEAHKPD